LIQRLSKTQKPGAGLSDEARQAVTWAGQLREFTEKAAEQSDPRLSGSLAALDAAVAKQGPEAQKLYAAGRSQVISKLTQLDQQLEAAAVEDERIRLRIERRRAGHYTDFPYDEAVERILAGLDK
jgi:hypothetical protein